MTTSEFIEALQGDLREVAALGDEKLAEALERLATVIRSSALVRLIDVLGEMALEISSELPGGHVEVRMAGQDAELVYVSEEEPETAGPVSQDEGAARITLRLSESLKSSIEEAAAAEGLSTNTWIVRALSRRTASRGSAKRTGKRITGFVQA